MDMNDLQNVEVQEIVGVDILACDLLFRNIECSQTKQDV